MKNFLIGILVGVFGLCVGGYAFVKLGYMPVGTHEKPLPLEAFFARTAIRSAVRKSLNLRPPIPATEVNLSQGAAAYRDHCAGCHGIPEHPNIKFSKAMFPHPPQLFEASGNVTDDPPGKIYWIIKHGIRLSGMPGFEDSLTDESLWQIALLLQNANQIPSSALKELKAKK